MLFLFLLRLLTGEVGRVEEERKLGLGVCDRSASQVHASTGVSMWRNSSCEQ